MARQWFAAVFLGAALAAAPASAEPPAQSIRPAPRPVQQGQHENAGAGSIFAGTLRPPAGGNPIARSARPETRPDDLRAGSSSAVIDAVGVMVGQPAASVCGDPAIVGTAIAPIQGKIAGCGVAAPVRITEVAGIRLSQPARMDCVTARALRTWIANGARPAVGRTGGGLAGLRVAAGYSCRTRNSRQGAKISEHGKGRAIDIAAIKLANGREISVLKGWPSAEHGALMRRLHATACGPFGTVLGPESDRFHRDHFHFDTARYRSGSYCR